LKLFIYDRDLEMLVKNPKAFDSFSVWRLAGQGVLLEKTKPDPFNGGNADEGTRFVMPAFASA
jgi:hypothetical protein